MDFGFVSEAGFLSFAVLWTVGGIVALGGLLTVVGFWSLGRSAYRKD